MKTTVRFATAMRLAVIPLAAVIGVGPMIDAEAAPAAPAPATAPATAPTEDVSASEASRAARYWTPERMREAKEDMPSARTTPSGDARSATSQSAPASRPEGPTGRGPAPTAPGDASPLRSTSTGTGTALVNASAAPQAGAAAAAPSYPYRGYYWTGAKNRAPAITTVRLFYTKASGGNSSCTGTVVNSENKSMVWTAGHCVFDTRVGRYNSNMIVCPAYSVHTCPYGQWTARTMRTTGSYYYYGNFNEDLGSIVVNPLNGRKLANYVGAQGMTWNLNANQYWYSFGHSAEPQWRTSPQTANLYVCESRTGGYRSRGNGGPSQIGIGCNMAGGASGGGWHVSFNSAGTAWIGAVNSWKDRVNEPHIMWGAYHGAAAGNLFNAMRY